MTHCLVTWPCVLHVCPLRYSLLGSVRDWVLPCHLCPLCPHCGCGRRRSSGWKGLPDVLCCCKPEESDRTVHMKWIAGSFSSFPFLLVIIYMPVFQQPFTLLNRWDQEANCLISKEDSSSLVSSSSSDAKWWYRSERAEIREYQICQSDSLKTFWFKTESWFPCYTFVSKEVSNSRHKVWCVCWAFQIVFQSTDLNAGDNNIFKTDSKL